MTTDNSKLVKFMNWLKKNRQANNTASTKIVDKYLNTPEADEQSQTIDYFHMDGDGDPLDDFGTCKGGESMEQREKRFCKGCHADVTKTMYCVCGDFNLLKEETLSESELNKLENGK